MSTSMSLKLMIQKLRSCQGCALIPTAFHARSLHCFELPHTGCLHALKYYFKGVWLTSDSLVARLEAEGARQQGSSSARDVESQ